MWVSQMNHIPMHIDHDRNMDWVSTQVRHSHLKENGKPLQYSYLENSMDRGAWWATVPEVTRVRHNSVTKQNKN